MKTISVALKAHFALDVITPAICWKITLRDGTIIRGTTVDKDLVIGGATYSASLGGIPSSISTTSNMEIDNISILIPIDGTTIVASDIRKGAWDKAQIELFVVNYEDLTQGAVFLPGYELSEMQTTETGFTCQVKGLLGQLDKPFCEQYSPICRASFGDSLAANKCKKVKLDFTYDENVQSVIEDYRQFVGLLGGDFATGFFDLGELWFTTGDNTGRIFTVDTHVRLSGTTGEFTLLLETPNVIQPSDLFSVVQGCDKLDTTCRDTFNNLVNFRGEPYTPGEDMRYGKKV